MAETYQVAIPSLNRSIEITQKTLKTLESGKVSKNKITIFVHTNDQKKQYLATCPGYNIIVSNVTGLINQRNFITNYYPLNQYIISMDDDVRKIQELYISHDDKKKLIDVKHLPKLFIKLYQLMNKKGAYLWGVHYSNPFFMKNEYALTFGFIDGGMYGYINRKLKELEINLVQYGDDTEIAVKYFKKDGVILRPLNIAITHNCSNNVGGLQSHNVNRLEQNEKDSKKLFEVYPDIFSGYKLKNNAYVLTKYKRPTNQFKDDCNLI
jgi:hypothetical protein